MILLQRQVVLLMVSDVSRIGGSSSLFETTSPSIDSCPGLSRSFDAQDSRINQSTPASI